MCMCGGVALLGCWHRWWWKDFSDFRHKLLAFFSGKGKETQRLAKLLHNPSPRC